MYTAIRICTEKVEIFLAFVFILFICSSFFKFQKLLSFLRSQVLSEYFINSVSNILYKLIIQVQKNLKIGCLFIHIHYYECKYFSN